MSIIIKEEDKEYHLFSVSHTYVNITPFTNPNGGSDFITYYRHGRLKKLYGLKVDVEYKELNKEDFKEIDRFPMYGKYGKSDIVYYRLISLKYDRLEKLKIIENKN